MLKFLVCSALVAVTSAGYLGQQGLHFNEGAAYAPHYENYEAHDYQFNYGVSDPHTGDHKSQWEVKEKGVVRGGYSLLEPDGTTRIVEYVADDDGFRAVVKKLGDAHHPDTVEAHGFSEPELHHEVPVVLQEPHHPAIVAPEPQIAYHAYDGQADNYAHVLGDSQIVPQVPYKTPEVPYTAYQAPQEFAYQPHHHQQIEPISTYQLPHESQGHVGNLQPIHSYPTFSSAVPESHFSGHQTIDPKIFSYEQALPIYSNEGIVSQPQAFGVPSGLGHQHQAEVPIYQGQAYQGVVPHHQQQIPVNSYVQSPEIQLPHQSADFSGYNGGYSNGGDGYYQQQGEYSQKIQNVLPPPKSLSHFKSEPFRIVVA